MVFGRAYDSSFVAFASGRRTSARRGGPALYPVMQRGAAAGDDGKNGTGFRSAGARSLRHDRSVASNVLESAAARGAQSGLGGAGNGRQGKHHGREGQPS